MKMSRCVIHALFVFGLWLGLGLQAQAQTDTVTYVYTDPQGTPLVKADASGNVIARYDYTPYGNSIASLGNPPDGPGYTGHVNDPETGLVYMQARYYQPVGRFLSPDPVGPVAGNIYSFNRYAYADDNPIMHIDPDGRKTTCTDNHCIITADTYNAQKSNGQTTVASPEVKAAALAGKGKVPVMLFALSALLFGLASSSCAQEQVLSPSELNTNSAFYKNKEVTVRGYLTLEPEGHSLYESKELNEQFRKGFDAGSKGFHVRDYMKYCLTIANPALLYRNRATLRGKTLVVTGKFLGAYRNPQVIDLGACPLPTAILIDMGDFKRRYGSLLPNK